MSNAGLLAPLDLLLRGGVCGLLLIAALLARDYSRAMAARLGTLFALGRRPTPSAPRRVCTRSWGGGRLPFWRWRPATTLCSGFSLRRCSTTVSAPGRGIRRYGEAFSLYKFGQVCEKGFLALCIAQPRTPCWSK